jgi:hypothetical protein
MGFKLWVLSWWTPNFVVSRVLDKLEAETAEAFKSLPINIPADVLGIVNSGVVPNTGSINQKRAAMAKQHAKLVDILVATLGREKGVELGRGALFEVGRSLGREVRDLLGVGETPADLIRAAKVLYRVLGIDFDVVWIGEGNATLVVNRCVLAEEYSELTCQVLSATDEGVMQGLNPNTQMKFREYITGGCPKCKADLLFIGEIQKK